VEPVSAAIPPLLGAVSKRLGAAAPRGIKVDLVLKKDELLVNVQRRREGRGGSVILDPEATGREALIEALDIVSWGISDLHGKPWPSARKADNTAHLAIDDDEIRIWFGESRWPTLTLEPIPLSTLPAPALIWLR
jgi:hypothetical protein